ncbi:MAG: hypothetical protein QXD05_01760 [Candidatus Pacearchaeota archaeon]
MKKLGYLMSIIGLVILGFSTEPVYKNFKFIQSIQQEVMMWVGVLLAILGVIFIKLKGSDNVKGKEVPIYKGREIVGYRIVK